MMPAAPAGLHDGFVDTAVTHGFVVRAVRFLLTGIPQQEFFAVPKIGNGEFLAFAFP